MQSRSASYIRRTQSKRLPMNVMATGGRARRRPRYDLNFANNTYGGLAAGTIVCSRASTAWGDTLAGTWASFPSNTMVRTDRGLQVWESRTNSVRNNTEINAVPGTPGTYPDFHTSAYPVNGLALNVIGTGTESGLDYIDLQLVGTASGTGTNVAMYLFDSTTQIVAVNGDHWSTSAFVTLRDGSVNNLSAFFLRVDERNSGGGALASSTTTLAGISLGTLGLSRFQVSRPFTQASAAFVSAGIYVSYSSGAVINMTFRVAREQIEFLPSISGQASSPIPTSSAAVTRAADVVSVPIAWSPGVGLFMTATGYPTSGNTYVTAQYIMSVDDGSTTNYVGMGRRQTNDVIQAFASAGPTPVILAVWTQNTAATVSLVDKDGYGAISFPGQTTVIDNTAGFPTGFNTIHIGCKPDGSSQWNGYITEATLNSPP